MKDLGATTTLLELARKSRYVEVFIYTGSTAAFAKYDTVGANGLREEKAILHTLHSGSTPYARTKVASHSLVLS
jgi:nucleoside-diphosphate-sugar epimerase